MNFGRELGRPLYKTSQNGLREITWARVLPVGINLARLIGLCHGLNSRSLNQSYFPLGEERKIVASQDYSDFTCQKKEKKILAITQKI